jgi:hypothetical protein
MWLGSAGEAPSDNNDGECVIEQAANGTVGAASGHLLGPSSHARNAEELLRDAGGSPTASVAMDGVDHACSLVQKKMLGGAGTVAGSVTLAQYLDSHIVPGTSEVSVFVCAPDTERTTNGEPLRFGFSGGYAGWERDSFWCVRAESPLISAKGSWSCRA